MPLFVFACEKNCGHSVERLVKNATAPVPPQIMVSCENCHATTRHNKMVSAPVVQTSGTLRTARRNDYRRKNPDWKENVVNGKTADGRKQGNLQERSMQAWGSAFEQQNGQSIANTRSKK